MFYLSLSNFRGFQQTLPVSIKPLTFLIGENSAGKSSFISALKYMLDFSSGREASFNKDPFQLGTFQQIAHYRGGAAGRAKRFSIKAGTNASIKVEKNNQRSTHEISLEVYFDSSDSQAAMSSIDVAADGDMLRLVVGQQRINIEFISSSIENFKFPSSGFYNRISRSEIGKYWPFLLEDIIFRFSRSQPKDENALMPTEVATRVKRLQTLLGVLSRELSGDVEATSAIRTKPLRTYTPGLESRDAEGSHVPYEIAKLYRSNKSAWQHFKQSIEQFGKSSDMFEEIGIKSFGHTASDPFQIQFMLNGPKMNLVDLGYGVSQVLPILYDVFSGKEKTHFLIQQPEVHLHPKAQAALGSFFIDTHLSQSKNFVVETHSDYIVDRARQAIASGRLRPNQVSILFFERRRLEDIITEIALDSSGDPIEPPVSYRVFFTNEELRTLGAY